MSTRLAVHKSIAKLQPEVQLKANEPRLNLPTYHIPTKTNPLVLFEALNFATLPRVIDFRLRTVPKEPKQSKEILAHHMSHQLD